MKHLLWFISFLALPAFAQVEFEELIYDFHLVEESQGPVTHKFVIQNRARTEARILYIQPSCGCTAASLDKSVIPSKEKSWIEISYDPSNRPGYFFKSIEVGFIADEDTIVRQIAVKGYTVSKDQSGPQTADVNYDIQLAPFHSNIKYADRWNIHKNKRFNTFIDDITYVIDKQNFAELKMVLTIPENASEEAYKEELEHASRIITQALKRRDYPSFSIGFASSISTKSANDFEQYAVGEIKIFCKDFTNHELEESVIKDLTPSSLPTGELPPPGLSERMIHEAVITAGSKLPTDKDYDRFIQRCTRNALSHREVWLGYVLYSESADEQKKAEKCLKQIRKDLIKQGVDPEGIFFHEPEYQDENLDIIRIAEFLPPPSDTVPTQESQIDSLDIFDLTAISQRNHSDYKEVNDIPVQDLPAYFQQLKKFVRRVDTTNQYFISMMDEVIEQIKDGHPIDLIMESSASKAPAEIKVDNMYVARLRAEESQEIIKSYLLNRGLQEDDIRFKEVIPLVSGPNYDLRYYLIQYYYYFQYLKIIPIYRTPELKQNYIPPYKINFSYNNLDVMNESYIFQAFCNKLADYINTHGYVKLILESSSSKVPTFSMGKNEHLSYHRAQEAKNKIYDEIRKRGINPSKVIITDERILVQGPEYNRDYKENAKIYEKYQYVKIVPYHNLLQEK